MHVLAMLYPRRALLWTIIGLLFVLNTDLVVLDYRPEVEPMIWLITLICVTQLAALVRGRRRAAAVSAPAR